MAALETKLTLPQLEAHLWRTAGLFRNKVSNQKDYILALFFFKRASDIYDEDTEAALAKLEGVPKAAELAHDRAWHPIVVPRGHSWDDVRNADEVRLGEALNDALGAIGRANPKQLAGVFEHTDFNNKAALPNADLAEILDHFHELGPLTSARVHPDMLGQAYEWLIAKFAAESGKGGGEFYTPAEVGKLCAGLLEPEAGNHIYDPTCGSGGLLLQTLANAESRGIGKTEVYLFGQELNPETWAIARMNMLLHGAGDAAEILRDDTIAAPAFRDPKDKERLRKFDRIIANPPFSPENWGHAQLKKSGDPWGRIKHLPPKKYGETAFLQHMVASMNDRAKLACILPNGCFFRGGGELAVRKDLVAEDLIEAVVQLPTDLFYGAGIPACLLICNAAKPADRKARILLIDASDEFERRDTKNALTPAGIAKVVAAFSGGDEIDGFSKWATQDEVIARRYKLLPRGYTRGEDNGEVIDLGEAVASFKSARLKREATETQVDALLALLEESD